MTNEELIPLVIDDFCNCIISRLDDVLCYIRSKGTSSPEVLIDKDSLLELILNIKQDFHDEEEIAVILSEYHKQEGLSNDKSSGNRCHL